MAVELAFFTVAALYAIIFIRSEITEWRRNKKRQQLDSKTPYDYALTNAIDERDRLLDELRTIQGLKRTEADTERIRNEIGTILSDDGEGAIEDVYDVDKAFMESTDLTFRQYYDVIKTTDDKRHLAGRATLERERQDEDLGILVEELTALKVEMEEKRRRLFEDGVIPIQEQADGTVSPILAHAGELDTSPMAAITGMSAAEAGWDAAAVSRAYARLGGNVREDDSKDGQFPDNGDEYADLGAIDKAIRDEQKVLCIYRNRNVEGFSGVEMAVGTLAKLRYRYGQTQYVILRVCSNNGGTHLLRISGEDLDEISLLGGESHGEIVYRKGEM